MSATARELSVRPVSPEDHASWRELYLGYRAFYGVAVDEANIATVWSWLHDPEHPCRGLLATLDGEPVGLAHLRAFPRPLSASHGLYLDDLFTAEAARGSGAASALLQRIAEIARDEGATLVRWITDRDNATARSLYDRVASPTTWVTYDLPPAP